MTERTHLKCKVFMPRKANVYGKLRFKTMAFGCCCQMFTNHLCMNYDPNEKQLKSSLSTMVKTQQCCARHTCTTFAPTPRGCNTDARRRRSHDRNFVGYAVESNESNYGIHYRFTKASKSLRSASRSAADSETVRVPLYRDRAHVAIVSIYIV